MSISPPGTARPTDAARQARRWWRPRTPLSWLATGVAALTVAAIGASAGAWLGWQDADELPSDSEAAALATALAPGATLEHTERFDAVFGFEYDEPVTRFIGGDDYRNGYVAVSLGLPPEGYAALTDKVRAQLTRQGWQATTDPYGYPSYVREELQLITYPVEVCRPHEPQACGSEAGLPRTAALALQFERTAPSRVAPWTALGWLAGLLLGWAAARGVAALLRRRTGPQATVATVIGAAGLAALLPATVFTNVEALSAVAATGRVADAVWGPYLHILLRLPANLGILCLLAAFTITALAVPAKPASADPPYPRLTGASA